jgi:hypothetical protein
MSGWKSRVERFLPWAIVGLFWAWKTAPIWRHFGSRHYAIRGPLLDTLNMLWLSWWTHFSSASADHSLLFSDLINYPAGGASAVDYSLAFLHVGVAGLLRGVMPDIAAHNLLGLAGFAFSLVALFLLLREVSGEGILAALFSCLVITFGLATSNQLPDLELLYFGYLPLALFCWLRYVDRGSWGWGVGALVLTGFTSYAQMYYGLALFAMLGLVSLVLFGGLPLLGDGVKRSFRRTVLVLGGGFGLALLFHARNIVNAITADTIVTPEFTAAVPWPFGLADGLWLLLVCVAPIWLGLWLGARRMALWGLLALPPALLSLGYALLSDWGGPISMPLAWLRSLLPFVWRITFPNRFVAPMLLALAASLLAFWRILPQLISARWARQKAALAGAFVIFFWLFAAFAPLVPSDCAPLMNMASGTSGEMLPDYPPPGLPVAALTRDDAATKCDGVTDARLPASALLWPFQPLETVAMPPIPPCLQEIGAEVGDFAILELSRCDIRGYVGYFHTAHEKAIAGYPCRQYKLAAKYDAPSKLSQFQALYFEDRARELMGRRDLANLGVSYVVHYDIPGCILVGRSGAASLGEEYIWHAEDFSTAYGPAVCQDEISTIYATQAE